MALNKCKKIQKKMVHEEAKLIEIVVFSFFLNSEIENKNFFWFILNSFL